jgi:hypothetical protein
MLAPSSARVLTCPRTQKWPQSTQNFELTSLLLINVQTWRMVARVISKKPLLPLPPLQPYERLQKARNSSFNYL